MLTSSIVKFVQPLVRRAARASVWPKLALALILGVTLGYAPTAGLTQGKRPIAELPPQAAAALGQDAALIRVVRKDGRVATYANGSDTGLHENPPTSFEISGEDDPNAKEIEISATLPKEFLERPGGPIEVIAVSVIMRAGGNTCYWDCYWVNGKRICECINL